MNAVERKNRWNKASVVALAGDLADREGLETLTLTRLAEAMGVRPPSLFNHVDSLAGLVRDLALAATEALATDIEAALLPGNPGASLARFMDAYRRFVLEHPGRYATLLRIPRAQAFADPGLAAAEERILGAALEVASGFGLGGDDALHAVRSWRALAHGFSELERQGGFGLPLDLDDSYRRAVRALTPLPGR